MNVRALPTCKKPVGDGAKRTRGLSPEVVEGKDSGISGEVSMVWGGTGIVNSPPEFLA
jgi:hypothetical protein